MLSLLVHVTILNQTSQALQRISNGTVKHY